MRIGHTPAPLHGLRSDFSVVSSINAVDHIKSFLQLRNLAVVKFNQPNRSFNFVAKANPESASRLGARAGHVHRGRPQNLPKCCRPLGPTQ